MKIRVIGGGLAGSEAALVAARLGCDVDLYEMRREVAGQLHLTPAHETTDFGELVCSNSLKSESENTAPWLLKQEMRRGSSALLRLADETAVPAGHALAVDRTEFAHRVTQAITDEPRIRVLREEVNTLAPAEDVACTILASGPLTSDALAADLARLTGSGQLAFYDSISPIVDADTIDMDRVYFKARWDKGTPDYINCPMNREEYDVFYEALITAEAAEKKEWENVDYFEGCLPIEVLARRGRDTLRFGPMKPVGLRDPRTDKNPWAVVQLRKENLRASSYNLVGFQNHLKFGDQARVLRLIPGLENAKFLRFGQIHRNTYVCAPVVLDQLLRIKPSLSQEPRTVGATHVSPAFQRGESAPLDSPQPCRDDANNSAQATQKLGEYQALCQGTTSVVPHTSPNEERPLAPAKTAHPILIAGQLSGVEGYTESIATGMLAGLYAVQIAQGKEPVPIPRATALGSLVHYITNAEAKHFQPANITFDLIEPLEEELRKTIRDKKERHRIQCERSLAAFDAWWATVLHSL
jgi:methylenetetrahydrofolate--tRNA-(uracil-5-)-methyltransferase